jgi:predicted O-methyltransferase YrrM
MSGMIESPEAYFAKMVPSFGEQIKRLESEALKEDIPIIGPVLAQMLYLIARLSRSTNVLELGSAIGYSSIFLASACKINGGRLITYECDPALAERARANLAEAGLETFVDLRCADAVQEIKTLKESMDMIFIDIEKDVYIDLLPWCKSLLSDNGLLVADNTGFKDADPFNQALYQDPDLESINLWSFLPGHSPQHDGFCLAVKRISTI